VQPGSSGLEDDADPAREARAYHFNVYLMVGMPYFLLGVVGFLVYRSFRQKARAALPAAPAPQEGQGDGTCSPQSLAEIS